MKKLKLTKINKKLNLKKIKPISPGDYGAK